MKWWMVTAVLLLLSINAMFEWVHPDEWQPKRDQSLGEILKEKTEEAKDAASEAIHRVGEKAKEMSHSAKETTKELGEGVYDRFQAIRQKSKEDLYEPMVRMMRHALDIFNEEDRMLGAPHMDVKKGWPSRYETNARLWREYPDEYLLFIDVPGIPRSELSCNITHNHLLVSGRHGSCLRPAKTAEGDERFCVERGVMESVRLPEDVNAEKLECRFKDGVIIARMPKMAVNGKKIPIHDYVPSWSERAKEAKDVVMEKLGVHYHHTAEE